MTNNISLIFFNINIEIQYIFILKISIIKILFQKCLEFLISSFYIKNTVWNIILYSYVNIILNFLQDT